jgi:hypothetical protein
VAIPPFLQKLARKVTQGNTPANIPPAPQMSLHQLTVTHVDTFSGVVGVQFPDPAGTVVQGVRFMQAYSAANPPSVGDTVWAHQYGTDLMVVGQHVIPTNFITPT